MRGAISFLVFVAAELYLSLQLYNAATFKAFTKVGRGNNRLVSLESEPIIFWLALIVVLVFFLILGWIIIMEICLRIDNKFKEFGGNYNINTVKAIIRSWSNTTNNKIKRDRRKRRPLI